MKYRIRKLEDHDCRNDPTIDHSWWEKDGNGIDLCRVCPKCIKAKLAKYRPVVLRPYTQDDVDEPIEPDAW